MVDSIVTTIGLIGIFATLVGVLLAYTQRAKRRDESLRDRGVENVLSGRIPRLEPYAKYWPIVAIPALLVVLLITLT